MRPTTSRIVRFGKSSEALIAIKRDFFVNNDEFVRHELRLAELYIAQPERERCMCCSATIAGLSFTKQGVTYVLCGRCGHLNGKHRDTDAYCAAVYGSSDGVDLGARYYSAEDRRAYDQRIDAIYAPKVEFLTSALAELGETPTALRYCDLGAGAGYFIAALNRSDHADTVGYEISESLVRFGNEMVGAPLLHRLEPAQTETLAESVEADVLVLLGTLEHLQRPREFLTAVTRNSNVKYLLISVPLFSLTVFFEMAFPDLMQRQLSAAHTHLYTVSSLEWMAEEFSIAPVAEWWFGTDLVDLYRTVFVRLGRNPGTETMLDAWRQLFVPVVDKMQLVLDQQRMSSEVHVLYRVR